ncbi:unnamed protein product, partial [Symbiodinium pilosum]
HFSFSHLEDLGAPEVFSAFAAVNMDVVFGHMAVDHDLAGGPLHYATPPNVGFLSSSRGIQRRAASSRGLDDGFLLAVMRYRPPSGHVPARKDLDFSDLLSRCGQHQPKRSWTHDGRRVWTWWVSAGLQGASHLMVAPIFLQIVVHI